ncbi:coiled-coil domain-containing protein 105 [Acipenser oxyrinchus oxyrinchus]|uniref:Coiled-coil domain-containing protein 105 n=1 Tax=Acipenser oxyrinchus oxyrinchus TaxID=40147 RepID=A0AAD8CQI0_ACIOX|nr:coiled-coil domain-containing protein 105 [Acipenser oxyrinchus oxyrinchus]
MSFKTVPLATVTIGPESWRDVTVNVIRLSDRLVKTLAPCRSGARNGRSSGSPVIQLREEPGNTAARDPQLGPLNSYLNQPRGKCTNGFEDENGTKKTATGKYRPVSAPHHNLHVSLKAGDAPPSFLRVHLAERSSHLTRSYTRAVRSLVTELRLQAVHTNDDAKRLLRSREALERSLADLRKDLLINKSSVDTRRLRPAPRERVRDGADYLLEAERKLLFELKSELEIRLKMTRHQLEMLCSCRKRLLDCAAERSRVLDLFPNSFADWTRSHSCSPPSPTPSPSPSPSPSQSRELLKASPATPCTPECQEALQAARTACLQSRALCREVKEAVDQAVSLGRAAHKATNDGLTQKIAETVNLTQHLQVSSGESRVAIQRVQRWYDENEHSEGRVLGPVSSADLLTRERLDRPQVQVYQRHAGTQLPEATAIVQGYAALRQSLLNTSQDLGLLHRTRLQLEENMQGKRAAVSLDSAIARLRRRNSDHRWTVPHLK